MRDLGTITKIVLEMTNPNLWNQCKLWLPSELVLGGRFDGRKNSPRRNREVFDLDVTASLKTGILWDAWIKHSIKNQHCMNEILITFRTSIKKIRDTLTLGVCSKCDKNINYNTWVCLFFRWFFNRGFAVIHHLRRGEPSFEWFTWISIYTQQWFCQVW